MAPLAPDQLDLEACPRRVEGLARVAVPDGTLAWVSQDRAPLLLDPATALLLDLFDGGSTLGEIVADIEAEVGPSGHDVAAGALAATRRLGEEGFLDDVAAAPGRRLASILFRQLTDGLAHEAAHAAEHGGHAAPEPWEVDPDLLVRDRPAELGEPDLLTLDLPSSPLRLYTTVPRIRAAVTSALPARTTTGSGPLLFAATDGGEVTVGRALFTLFGTRGSRLVVTADEEELATRLLRHLSLSVWLAEEPGLWWTSLRTLLGPDGAVLVSSSRLNGQPGFLRAVARAGYEVVDSVLSALDPHTREVVVHPTRFDVDRGELSRAAAGPARRVPLATVALGPTDFALAADDGVGIFAKALAVAIEPGDHVERQAVLEAAAGLAAHAHRVLLVEPAVAAAVASLRRPT
jgi:hypothetical protein